MTRLLTCLFRIGLIAGLPAFLLACVTTPRTEFVGAEERGECVVLLHGLNRSWRSMRPMAEALQDDGLMTVNVDYPSRSGPVEELVPLAVEPGLQECREEGANKIHFVTHSIGGILLRYAQQQSPIVDLGRVVMLAPPNQGTEIIDKTEDWPGAILVSGEAGLQLGTGEHGIAAQLGPVDFELGVVAGTRTINPWMSAMLPDPDDGKVSVANTRVAGMTDFLIVDISHHSIVRSQIVIDNTLAFLRTGKFIEADQGKGE